MRKRNTVLFHLPVDVIFEILARVPVKSLLRFRRVCKSWYSLIRIPSFVDLNLRYTCSIEDNYSAILVQYERFSHKTHVSYLSDRKDATINLSLDDFPQPISFFDDDSNDECGNIKAMFEPGCDGIICVWGQPLESSDTYRGRCDLIALWNPATREIKRLPRSNVPLSDNVIVTTYKTVFGFDVKSKDYKVVRFSTCATREEPLFSSPLVEVFSLGSKCWKKIDAVVPAIGSVGGSAAYLDGFYYWVSAEDGRICTFDFANELFNTIARPNNDNGVRTFIVKYKGSIALFLDFTEYDGYDCKGYYTTTEIWVLSRDESKDTWSKLHTLYNYRSEDSMLGAFRNGNFLEERFRKLIEYDPTGSEEIVSMKTYDLDNFDQRRCRFFNYVQSLVSFN